jgi:hypothetical protein
MADGSAPGGNSFDLGDGHRGEYSAWAPDRELNPQHADRPDVDRWGLIIFHTSAETGGPCAGFVTFSGDVQREVAPDADTWDVLSWDPLTISPSVQCSCGDHGFIQEGRWVRA